MTDSPCVRYGAEMRRKVDSFIEKKHILSLVRKAVQDYDLIAENDRICVGISGGKDSVALLSALAALRRI